MPASTRCNSRAESFAYSGSDLEGKRRVGHDEEVVDLATQSPEIWQESDSIDNELGGSSSVRQFEVIIDLSTCADIGFCSCGVIKPYRKLRRFYDASSHAPHHDLRPSHLKRVEVVRCLIRPARHGNASPPARPRDSDYPSAGRREISINKSRKHGHVREVFSSSTPKFSSSGHKWDRPGCTRP